MSLRRITLVAVTVFACLAAWPRAAHAQGGSTIAGTVKDASGAVLPGVTVEVASDVLIEKTRTAVTDGSGLYKIIDLRPGIYVVTFTLTGFQSIKREGLELPASFTATIDESMKVGSLEESVTVSGASPVVDVTSNVKEQTLPRDVLDAVPNAHTIQSVGQLIPGVSLTAPDTGGSQQMQQTYFSVHGLGAAGTTVMIDGLVINSEQGDGAIQSYFTTAGSQEMVYQTGGGGGESPSGGLNINMVPREGGNRFSGSSSLGWENWQSNNLTQNLINQGVVSTDKIGNYHDFDVAQGGPIMKDKLWFFLVGRLQGTQKPVAGTTNSATQALFGQPAAMAAALAACRAAAASGGCPQGVSPENINSALGRVTMQVNSKNKLQLYLDRVHKDRASALAAGDDQAQTGIHWTSPDYATDYAKWTSTVTSRLLVEGGWSSTIERYDNYYQPGIEQPLYGPLWAAMAARDNTTEALYSVAPSGELRQYPDRYNLQGSVSYVTGSHNIKLGFLDSWGDFLQGSYHNGDLTQNYQDTATGTNQVQNVTIYPTDPRWNNAMKAGADIYLQDSWTKKRLTLTGGIRWDYVQEYNGAEPIQQGTFAVIPAFPNNYLPALTNWSPTISGVYDLFGNGKTAIRAGFRHFVATATDSLAALAQPVASGGTTLPWTDVNGDNIAEYSVTHNPTTGQLIQTCVYQTPGCEINFATLPANFGSAFPVIDPNLLRPSYNQYNVAVVHELAHGISGSVEYFRTTSLNPAVTEPTQNLVLGTPSAQNPNFSAFTVFSPIDGHPVTEYDYASLAVAQKAVANQTFTDSTQTTLYQGVDISLNARLPGGLRLFGGTTTERTISNTCDLGAYNPNLLLYCDQANLGNNQSIPWKTQVKLSGTYPLPWWGLILNGTYQGLPGYTEAASTYTISKASTYVTCPGNSAAAGCVVGAKIDPNLIMTSASVTLDAPNTTLTPRTNEIDFGLAKRVKIGRVRFDPRVDVFNALNSSAFYTIRTAAFSPVVGAAGVNGPAAPQPAANSNFSFYRQPARFLDGRILRIGFNVTW